MTETWKDVAGFEGIYAVSSFGLVRALPRRVRFVSKAGRESFRDTAERVCAVNVTRNGYALVHFQVDKLRSVYTIHELVAAAFIGPRPEGHEINHIDGDKLNNHATNLEYCTSARNKEHAVDLGLNTSARKVCGVRLFEVDLVFPSIARAAQFAGVTDMTIRRAIKLGYDVAGRSWSFA